MVGKRAILIAGPTAGGKSALALDAARALGGIVINADSMQVYADLRVLTARPGPEEEAAAPHRLYGVVAGGEPFSVGDWLARASAEVAAAWEAGAVPVLTGGTGLYFAALLGGLAQIPPIPPQIREKWRKFRDEHGASGLRAALAERDPAMAARPGADDPQRLLRALEVIEATGRSLAAWQAEPAAPSVLAGAEVTRIVVAPPRETVYARADARVAAMIEAGALEEVRALLGQGLDPGLPVMKAIGVAELGACLRGETGLEAALETMRTQTRRYAKRQLTWARGRMGDWIWARDPEEARAALGMGAGAGRG